MENSTNDIKPKKDDLEIAKLNLHGKKRRITRSIHKLSKKYEQAKENLENNSIKPEQTDDLFMEKARLRCSLMEKSLDYQKILKRLTELYKFKNQLNKITFFNREDMVNIITYLISIIEDKQLQIILHDEINQQKSINYYNFAELFPCLVISTPKTNNLSPIDENQLIDTSNFPYLNDFLTKIVNYKIYKSFEYMYPANEPLSYEELYNLANDFIEEEKAKVLKK